MHQLLLPFTKEIEVSNAEHFYNVPYFEHPKDLNETLLNLQHDWLILKDKKAWARLWQLSIAYAESEILKQKEIHGFRLASDEKEDKALNAVEYVLRRYTTRRGWCVKKSFISQIYGGVMHALWSMNLNQKFDADVEHIDFEETLGDKERDEVTWQTKVHGFSLLAFTKEKAMELKEAIKKYLEEACKTDEALADAYKEDQIDACCDYIRSQARKEARGSCACIEDVIVYKWARDFMYGDIAEKDKKAIIKAGKKDTSLNPNEYKTDAELEDEKHNYIKPFVQKAAIIEKKAVAEDPRQLNLFDFGGAE